MIEFIIPFELPTLNEYINAERGNKIAASQMKKKYTNIISTLCCKLPKLNKLYDIEIEWTTKDNKKDPDNIYFAVKFILDGLVLANKLNTDGRTQIRNIDNKIFTDKNVSIKVKLIEVN